MCCVLRDITHAIEQRKYFTNYNISAHLSLHHPHTSQPPTTRLMLIRSGKHLQGEIYIYCIHTEYIPFTVYWPFKTLVHSDGTRQIPHCPPINAQAVSVYQLPHQRKHPICVVVYNFCILSKPPFFFAQWNHLSYSHTYAYHITWTQWSHSYPTMAHQSRHFP